MTYIITHIILLLLKWGVTSLSVKTVLRYSNSNMDNWKRNHQNTPHFGNLRNRRLRWIMIRSHESPQESHLEVLNCNYLMQAKNHYHSHNVHSQSSHKSFLFYSIFISYSLKTTQQHLKFDFWYYPPVLKIYRKSHVSKWKRRETLTVTLKIKFNRPLNMLSMKTMNLQTYPISMVRVCCIYRRYDFWLDDLQTRSIRL